MVALEASWDVEVKLPQVSSSVEKEEVSVDEASWEVERSSWEEVVFDRQP